MRAIGHCSLPDFEPYSNYDNGEDAEYFFRQGVTEASTFGKTYQMK